MNTAQKLLVAIGGTAELVAGHMGHYYADIQTEKKPSRPRPGQALIKKGTFGRNVIASFDAKRGDLETRQARHHEHLIAQTERKARQLATRI